MQDELQDKLHVTLLPTRSTVTPFVQSYLQLSDWKAQVPVACAGACSCLRCPRSGETQWRLSWHQALRVLSNRTASRVLLSRQTEAAAEVALLKPRYHFDQPPCSPTTSSDWA